jgi:hypothetical protein
VEKSPEFFRIRSTKACRNARCGLSLFFALKTETKSCPFIAVPFSLRLRARGAEVSLKQERLHENAALQADSLSQSAGAGDILLIRRQVPSSTKEVPA